MTIMMIDDDWAGEMRIERSSSFQCCMLLAPCVVAYHLKMRNKCHIWHMLQYVGGCSFGLNAFADT